MTHWGKPHPHSKTEKNTFTCKQIMQLFCSNASAAKACSDVDDSVNKRPLWLHLDLRLNCRHMLQCTLSWSKFQLGGFLPPQLCLSKDFPHTFPGYVEMKRHPAKHSSPLLCQEAFPRQKKLRTSEETDLSITRYYKHVAVQLLLIYGD